MRRQTEDRHTLATRREHPTRSRDRVRIPVGVALLVLSALAVVVSLAPAQSADATLEAGQARGEEAPLPLRLQPNLGRV
jgi:hypothetical protein